MENLLVKEKRMEVIKKLKKIKRNFAKRLIKELEKRRRKRREINLYKINKYANDNDTIIVPGKVLGLGNVDKKIKIFAFAYSDKALEKLKKAKVKILKIEDLSKANNVKIIR